MIIFTHKLSQMVLDFGEKGYKIYALVKIKQKKIITKLHKFHDKKKNIYILRFQFK